MNEKELAQALFQAGLLTEDQIRVAAEQRTAERSFTDVIVQNGWVTPEQIAGVTGEPPAAAPWGTLPPTTPAPPPPMPGAPPTYTAPPYAPPIPPPTGFTPGALGQAPPYPGAGTGGGLPPSPRPGLVSTDAIGEAWALLKPNIGVWVAAVLVALFISGIFSGFQQATTPHQPNGRPELSPLSSAFSMLSVLVSQCVTAGLLKMAITNLRTGRAELNEMFNLGDVIGNVIIAAILTLIVVVVGFVLCVIPGIIALLGLSMTNMLIVDQKMDAVAAMSRSWQVMQSRLGALFVLGLVLLLINIAGLLACCVGYLVTLALTQLTLAVVYRDVFYGTSPVPLQTVV